MRPILEIGSFLPTDISGAVVRTASADLIPAHWKIAVDEVVADTIRRMGGRIHSIYLRGSVAAGKAIDGHSDLDIIVLTHYNFFINSFHVWTRASWEAELSFEIKRKHEFVGGLELVLASYGPGFVERNNGLPMILATQAICLFGEDIRASLPAFSPGQQMMYYNGRMAHFTGFFLDDLARTNAPRIVEALAQRITKAILRCGFELVMEREGRYTRDLFPCYSCFAQHYPERRDVMHHMLELYVNPVSDRIILLDAVSDMCRWMIAVERQVDLRIRPDSLRRLFYQLGARPTPT